MKYSKKTFLQKTKRFVFLFIILIFISCKSDFKTANKNTTLDNDSLAISNDDTTKAIKTLKEFYILFYGSDKPANENLKSRYLSTRVLKRIDSLTSDGENLILDYDPFIQGQDFDAPTIKKTLEISPLKNENEYRVSFLLFRRKDEKRTNIDLLLKKDGKGDFLIYSILNDEYLNFNDVKTDASDKNDEKDYEELMRNNISTPEKITDNLIFTKGPDNSLQINTDILDYIQKNTTATQNQYTIALEKYVTHEIIKFYDDKDSPWTETELIKIIAFASNTTDPLHQKLWKKSPDNWHNGMWGNILSFTYLVYRKPLWGKLQEQFKKENYYNLPNLKAMVSYAMEFDKFGPP